MGSLLMGLLQFVCWLVLGLIGNILLEWLFMGLLWPEAGVSRSQQLLEAELKILQQDVRKSLIADAPADFALTVASDLHQALYQKTGLMNAMAVIRQQQQGTAHTHTHLLPETRFRRFINRCNAGAEEYLLAAMLATQVYALRLSVLFLSIPVFVLAGLVGAIDGIVQRDLNRWRGGRELGQRYHLAKSFIAPGLSLPWIVYLAWPTPVQPVLIILPFAVFVGLVVAITTATFKKYF